MKRYPPFEPREYVEWRLLPEVLAEFGATLERHPGRHARLQALPPAALLALYEGLVRFRLHDVTLNRWVRRGVLSKAWLGTGEEAVTIGAVRALRAGDLVGPMIRNAGACHEMGMPVADMLRAYIGTFDQINRGRDLHTGSPSRGVVPPISFVASLVPVMAGMALAARLQGTDRVALTFVGDGATRTSEFHEGLNFAAVQRLPLITVIQDNGVALGTRRETHSKGPLSGLARAYGVTGLSCDGNNVLDVHGAALEAVDLCRAGGPVLIFASTFRMGGHATHDEAEARALFPEEDFAHWGARDPVGVYEAWLTAHPRPLDGTRPADARRVAALNRRLVRAAEARVTDEVERAAEEALRSREERMPHPASALGGVLAEPGEPEDPAFGPLIIRATGALAPS